MRKPNDGGPAFPLVTRWTGDGYPYEYTNGMSLRDWFAGMALVGYMARPDAQEGMVTAEDCYWYADAMLAVRERQP